MKIITPALVLLILLSVSVLAQTSPATEPRLLVKHFRWYENSWTAPCDDCAGLPQKVLDYRWSRRTGVGDFAAWIVLKNLGSKSIKSVNLDFVFRDTATEQEFLTYHLLFEREIGRGKTREILHKVPKGKMAGNDLISRTRFCGDGPLLLDRKTRQLVRIRDNAKLLKSYPCYYIPAVTRIEYTDGSIWEP